MTRYLKDASFADWFNLYLQVLFSLRLAHTQLDYTHYDLHTGNVLVRQLTDYEGSFYIPYTTERGTEYLLVERIASIIDYGFSHIRINSPNRPGNWDPIAGSSEQRQTAVAMSCDSTEPFCKVDGLHFGKWGLQKYGILPDKSRLLYDAYKLLLFSAAGFDLHDNREALEFMEPLVKFFNTTDSLTNIILDEDRIYYSLRENHTIDRVTLDDYLSYIRQQYDGLSYFLHEVPNKGVRVFGCNGTDICTVTPNDYSQIGFSDQLKIADLFAFYDLHRRWNNRNMGAQAKQLMESFSQTYSQLVGVQLKDLEAKLIRSKSIFDRFIPIQIDNPNYSQQIMKYLKAYDLYQEISLSITVIKYAATLYNDKKTLKKVRKSSSALTKFKQQLKDKYYSRLVNDQQKILNNLDGIETNIDLTEGQLNKILSTINQVISKAKL